MTIPAAFSYSFSAWKTPLSAVTAENRGRRVKVYIPGVIFGIFLPCKLLLEQGQYWDRGNSLAPRFVWFRVVFTGHNHAPFSLK